MQIVFRTDASLQIGSGHVMRCLTLADALKARGAQCNFICRAHPGNLMEVIHKRGYKADCLPFSEQQGHQHISDYTVWLGSTWQVDAQESAAVLVSQQADWLVVDHYALDHRWETALKPRYKKLMVIDDLADRVHNCDLLLDQNLGRQPQDYADLVPRQCQILTGTNYALLRPEFAELRPFSLQRRQAQPALRQLLITMGGVDLPNATAKVLQALKTSALPQECRISVVMGLKSPWLKNVLELAFRMPWPTEVVFDVNDMAQRMVESDLAIGAAGSTSWERCCLGLPTLMLVLAHNQEEAAAHLQKVGAAKCLAFNSLLHQDLHNQINCFIEHPQKLRQMSACASTITDGLGVERLVASKAIFLN